MKITKAEFIKSAADEGGFLSPVLPVIAVAGKSNVGKSTFINMLAAQKKLAKTSNTPGRTRLVNYFDFGGFVLADLPGYGYAEVSKAEKEKWGKTMDAFFAKQKNLAHVLLLVDIRHDPTADDRLMVQFLHRYAIPFTVLCNKSDKLGKSRVKPAAKAVAQTFFLTENAVIPVSGESGAGKDAVLGKIAEILARYKEYGATRVQETVEEEED